jgi:lipopolysaccharide/colanic/teichoic acid biosynthesis glycosyltransferase
MPSELETLVKRARKASSSARVRVSLSEARPRPNLLPGGRTNAANVTQSELRRLFEMVCAGAGLLLLSPLLLLIALAIKLKDGGSVFYLQPRLGKDFREFRVLKFRTMVHEADRKGFITGPNDPRITPLGRFLRKYKLDELPQLINILMGDMQLVGPRPEVKRYVEMFHSEYALLLQDRPGITDPAALAYRHEEEILEADRLEEQYVSEILPLKLRLSLGYLERRTFLSDLGIVLRTVLPSRAVGQTSSHTKAG